MPTIITTTTTPPPPAPSPASSATITASPSSSLSARSRRKRSTPTASSKDTLQSCSSTSSLVYPVPESVSWLEQLTLKLTVDKHAKADAVYVLTVEHAKSKSSWRHARSFEDYRSLQRRLLKAIRHGHFCHAECPWLYTFIRSYFPKSCLFGHVIARRQIMEQRREILEQCLLTLQSFLANRGNHCCSVLTSAVADEVLAFINGEEGALHQLRHCTPASPANATNAHATHHSSEDGGSLHRGSWGSHSNSGDESYGEVHEERDESEASRASSHEDENICGLCRAHLSDEAHSPSSVPLTPTALANETLPASPAASNSTETVSSSESLPSPLPIRKVSKPPSRGKRTTHYYTTRLACGHQFHDECIVPKLNESMHCPTCGKEEASRS